MRSALRRCFLSLLLVSIMLLRELRLGWLLHVMQRLMNMQVLRSIWDRGCLCGSCAIWELHVRVGSCLLCRSILRCCHLVLQRMLVQRLR